MQFLKTSHKIIILLVVFVVSLAIYASVEQKEATRANDQVVSTLATSQLPLVWPYMFDTKMNMMRGYVSEVSSDVTYDTLTLLPDDRKLSIHIENNRVRIDSVSFEIRSRDLSELIEQTEVKDFKPSRTDTEVVLPIQNLLTKDTEYRLDIILELDDERKIHYYTRIMLASETGLAKEMIDIATKFSKNNYDYDLARENTIYMETDGTIVDNALSFVNLKSTWNSLAYNDLELVPSANPDVRLSIYDGNTGEVIIRNQARRTLSNNTTENYEIEESISMRMGTARIYMMNYARHTTEIFDGNVNVSSGKRILLGIDEEDNLECMTTEDEGYTYFVANGDLWGYDNTTGNMTEIWSFRSDDFFDYRNNCNEHNIKLLRCSDSGKLTFLVYGYMNRGKHEGETGISYMTYDATEQHLKEAYFIPVNESYDKLDLDIKEFAYLGENTVFYLKIAGTVYAIDTLSGSYMVVVSDMKDGTYAISKNQDKFAWQEDNDKLGSSVVHIMDTNTGIKDEIHTEDGVLLKVEGFIGRDIVLSMKNESDKWDINGIVRSIPAFALEIRDDGGDVLKHYEKPGEYIGKVETEDARVNMSLLEKTADGGYRYKEADSLVSSVEAPDRPAGYGSYISDDKAKVFYIQLPEDSKSGKVKLSRITDYDDDSIVINGIRSDEPERYFAYAGGKLISTHDNLADAVVDAYDQMGSVRYEAYAIYNRSGTVTSRIVGDYQEKATEIYQKRAKGELLDLFGMPLRPALYYVGLKYPVLAYRPDGTPMVIYAYDKSTISCYEFMTGTRKYYGIDEASEMFDSTYNDFSCDFTQY